MKLALTRLLVILTLLSGTVYVTWRWGYSVNWDNWWIAVPLVLAETYALVDAYLFGVTMWRMKVRGNRRHHQLGLLPTSSSPPTTNR